MLIRNILNEKGTEVYDIGPDNTVYEAIEKMADKDIGALLVMERDQLKGIITERDYRNKVILKGRRSNTTAVKEIMSSNLYTVEPTDTVETCMALMTDRKFRHLPVVFSLRIAFSLICLTLSRERPNFSPISSRVMA